MTNMAESQSFAWCPLNYASYVFCTILIYHVGVISIFFLSCWCYLQESGSESDESDEESDVYWNLILGASEIALKYTDLYLAKNPPMTSILSGMGWLLETFRTSSECHKQLRMSNEIFMDLRNLLVRMYGLESSLHMDSKEMLAVFLYTCGGNESNSRCQIDSSTQETPLVVNLMRF